MKKILATFICFLMLFVAIPISAARAADEETLLPETPEAYEASDYAVYWSKMAVGRRHTAVVKPAGTVAVWGDNTNNQLDLPEDLTGVKAVAAGDYHTLALKEDGTLVGWGQGYDSSNQLVSYAETIPAGLTDVKSIAAGSAMSAAVKNDGSVVIWGHNSGIYDVSSMSNVVQIAINGKGAVTVDNNGTVTGWGTDSSCTSVPEGLEGNVVAVGAGTWHWLALKNNGTVAVWGYADHISAWKDSFTNLTGVRAIGGGRMLAVALLADDSLAVYSTGSAVPAGVDGVSDCQALAVGVTSEANGKSSNVYVMKNDGTVSAYGPNSYGQADVPAGLNLLTGSGTGSNDAALSSLAVTDCALSPEFDSGVTAYAVDISNEITSVEITASTSDDAAAMRINGTDVADGEAYIVEGLEAGENTVEIVVTAEDGTTVRTYTLTIRRMGEANPLPLTALAYQKSDYANYARRLAAGDGHVLVLKKDGTVVAWGNSSKGEGDIPRGLDSVTALAAGYEHSLALKDGGTITAWGSNSYGQCDVPEDLEDIVDIAAGQNFSAALDKNGRVYVWGENSDGQCNVPGDLNDAGGVVDIACGTRHMLALKEDGTVAAWGFNYHNQSAIPDGLNNVVAIAASFCYSMALKADGTVNIWGTSIQGKEFEDAYIQNVRAISLADDYAAGIKWDGTMAVWGDYYNDDIDFSIPQSDKEVMAISSKTGFLTALYEDGTVTVLEDINSSKNANGICYVPEGLNLFADDPEPYSGPAPAIPQNPEAYAASDYARAATRVINAGTDIGVLNMDGTVRVWEKNSTASGYGKGDIPADLINAKVKAIDGATLFMMALKEDGTVSVWGTYAGEQKEIPEGLSGVEAIAAGRLDCLALKEDGTVVAWGGNNYGQCNVPEGLVGVEAISVSTKHCLALKEDGTVAAWGSNDDGQCDVPEGLDNVVRIQAVGSNSIALKEDGTIVVWGNNEKGQCDVPEDLSNVVDFCADTYSIIALKANGTVALWGRNMYGKLNVPPGLHDVAAVYTNTTATIAVKTDGSMVIWGRNTPVDYESLSASTNVLDAANYPIVIFRDGTLKYFGSTETSDDEIETGVNEFLEGLNVLSGHYFAIDKAELLNPAGQSITSVAAQGGYRIKASVANNYASPTDGLTIIQVRGGSGATSSGGGLVLGCVGLSSEIPVSGSTVSSDFTMPAGISGTACVDVFVWDGWDTMVPRAEARQDLSFSVTQ